MTHKATVEISESISTNFSQAVKSQSLPAKSSRASVPFEVYKISTLSDVCFKIELPQQKV
jgi:hypothetical protein